MLSDDMLLFGGRTIDVAPAKPVLLRGIGRLRLTEIAPTDLSPLIDQTMFTYVLQVVLFFGCVALALNIGLYTQ
jgi:hypothetical protein